MDVTLRDGGYLFDHQISGETVRNVVGCLDEAGIGYIEVGHGISVGASRSVVAAGATDLGYAKAARDTAKRAKIGMIALPSLATERDLKELRPHLDFIRIGTNVDEIGKAARLVEQAKKLGFEVFLQMIRSSRLSPEQLATAAKTADEMGVDVIYLVDSAGSWSPWEVAPAVREARRVTHRPLGFHAHNHLGVALANALVAVDEGCRWIDASLRGIGRGAGNVPIELLLLHLMRRGTLGKIDMEMIDTAAGLILEDLPPEKRGISRDNYLPALHRIDLYPWKLYQRIAAVGGVEIGDLVKELGKTAGGVEIMPEDIASSLRALGADPDHVFDSLGIKRPSTTRKGS